VYTFIAAAAIRVDMDLLLDRMVDVSDVVGLFANIGML